MNLDPILNPIAIRRRFFMLATEKEISGGGGLLQPPSDNKFCVFKLKKVWEGSFRKKVEPLPSFTPVLMGYELRKKIKMNTSVSSANYT